MEASIKQKQTFSSPKSKRIYITVLITVILGAGLFIAYMESRCWISEFFAPEEVIVRLEPLKHYEPINNVPYDDKENILHYVNGYHNGWFYYAEHNSYTISHNGLSMEFQPILLISWKEGPYSQGYRKGEEVARLQLEELYQEAQKNYPR